MVGWILVGFTSEGSQQRKVPAHVKDDGVEVLVRPLEEGVEVKN
jgi:hypothetical protein